MWIDHARLDADDLDWLAPVQTLTLWAVDVPPGFLAELPHLRLLDLRGGSATSAEVVAGCTQLHGLVLNQIRGLEDLTELPGLLGLRLLKLYGLPQLRVPPSLRPLTHLARLELGSLMGITTLEPLLEAPSLREVRLSKKMALTAADVETIANHPALSRFGWDPEGVPAKTWVPVVERVGLPEARAEFPKAWLAAHVAGGDGPGKSELERSEDSLGDIADAMVLGGESWWSSTDRSAPAR